METIDPEEAHQRALARWAADVELAEYDLGSFIELTTPEYGAPEHLRPLLDVLDRSMREPVRLIVELPPRHGKTETLLHSLVRRMRYRPGEMVAYCSYSGPLALRKSRRARDMAVRANLWTSEETLTSRARGRQRFDPATAMSHWETIDGGSFTAGGRRGSFTGDGYGMFVYDDPYKGREEAESELVQESAIEQARQLAGRLEQHGTGVVSHQAWNDADVSAVLQAELDVNGDPAWEVVSLPVVLNAQYDDDDNLIGGTPLWPARWSLAALARKKHDVGEYNWYSQYTNDRKPRGDAVFGEPARYIQPEIDGSVVVISCDPGIEEDKMKDSSGIVAGAIYSRPGPHHTSKNPQWETRIDVLHAEDQWRDIPDLLDYLELLQTDRFRGAPIVLEEVSAFKALSQVARRLNPKLRLYPVTPRGSKLLRAQPTGKAWNGGRIRTPFGDSPYNGAWVLDYHREMQRFTGRKGGKDNRVDATTQLFDYGQAVVAVMAGAATGGESEWASSPF
jgi:hypothetical protein